MDENAGIKENKVRFFGAPEQIFKAFASTKDDDGNSLMSYQDFFQAMTPYNYQAPKDNSEYFAKYKEQISSTMKVASNTEEDELITFNEFYFFVLVCQLQEKVFIKEFNKFKGKMTAKQIARAIYANKNRTNFCTKQAFKKDQEKQFLDIATVMCEKMLDGKQNISYREFMDFRNKMIESLWHYEFHQFERD
jgi:hypothetical protein